MASGLTSGIISGMDGFIIKLSSEGVEEWTKFTSDSKDFTHLSDVKIHSDGHIYVCGHEYLPNHNYQSFVSKFDSRGKIAKAGRNNFFSEFFLCWAFFPIFYQYSRSFWQIFLELGPKSLN